MQACPYDALYIDPVTQTAAKCHYCAHRVEVGLEPACVIVCPVQAIVAGDLDDASTPIARLVAGQQVQVRKPEQGTQPKLFYVGAEVSALAPEMQRRDGQYMFAQASTIPVPGRPNRATAAAAPVPDGEPVDLLRMARTVYDVAHAERPWGWKVSTYLWTKSVAAGVLMVAALGMLGGLASGNALAARAAPLLALVFLALTTALLVADLKRPERFLFILVKPNWRSWLVWGGWILMAYGGIATLWLLAGLAGRPGALIWLAVPAIFLAGATAGYSAFLFGQAEGRDFWQSPLLLPHLLVAALAAGSAALLLVARATSDGLGAPRGLRLVLLGSLLATAVILIAELFGSHPTRDAGRAARYLARGPLAPALWAGVVAAGLALPAALLVTSTPAAWTAGAVLALIGLWIYEDLWVRAGQSIPLS
jgi:formate-dependent nitrite reductase membrane component NrfD